MKPVRYVIIKSKPSYEGGVGYWVSVHRRWLGPGRIYNCRNTEQIKEVIERVLPAEGFGSCEQDYSADSFGYV